MIDITKELKEKLLSAKSAGELEELVRASGQEIGEDELKQLWDEVCRAREQSMKELSDDELEAVSGGGSLWFNADRDWLANGCEATVEPGSWCGSNDACRAFDVTYDNRPVRYCSKCGAVSYKIHPMGGNEKATWSRCTVCGFEQWCDNAENLVY